MFLFISIYILDFQKLNLRMTSWDKSFSKLCASKYLNQIGELVNF